MDRRYVHGYVVESMEAALWAFASRLAKSEIVP